MLQLFYDDIYSEVGLYVGDSSCAFRHTHVMWQPYVLRGIGQYGKVQFAKYM